MHFKALDGDAFAERIFTPELPTAGPRIRAKRRAAAWRQQISRAAAYALDRAQTAQARADVIAAYEALERTPDFAKVRAGSDFAPPRHRPFNAREASEIMKAARAIERGTYATRERGAHGGVIGRSALRVLEALLFVVWPGARKGMFPSLARIAALAQVSVRTVQTALVVLRLLGFITVRRRTKRVATPLGTIIAQDTNAYAVHPPTGLGAVGADLFGRMPDGNPCQAKGNRFNNKTENRNDKEKGQHRDVTIKTEF